MDRSLDLETIRKTAKSSGYKTKHLAMEAGVKPCTMSAFLNGRRMLGTSALILLCQSLGISTERIKVVS